MHRTCLLSSRLQPLTAAPTRLTATEWQDAPRGMGDAFIANMIARRTSKQSKPVWDRPAPKKVGTTHLDSEHRAKARKRAQRAGRHYPNMVDNMHEAADQKSGRRKAAKKTTRRRVAKKTAAKRSTRKSGAAKRRATKRKSS